MATVQKVVRVYPHGWTTTTKYLDEALREGYIVKFVTPLPKGILEYIVEKEVNN